MLASGNEYLDEASKTIFQLSADEQIRKRCRDREEYYQDLANYERAIADKDSVIKKLLAEKEELLAEIERLNSIKNVEEKS